MTTAHSFWHDLHVRVAGRCIDCPDLPPASGNAAVSVEAVPSSAARAGQPGTGGALDYEAMWKALRADITNRRDTLDRRILQGFGTQGQRHDRRVARARFQTVLELMDAREAGIR